MAEPLETRRDNAAASAPAAASGAGHDRPITTGQRSGVNAGRGENAAQRREREARYRASFETRQQQAAEHRREVLDQAQQRAKGRPGAAPLPVPASMPAR